MSKFSSYLEHIVKRSGEPLARIAKNAGLERTSIHKALKDERILPYTSLKKLIQYFQLTITEARELNLYYDMLLQGEDAYQIHAEICGLMSDLSHLHFSPFIYQMKLSDKMLLPTQLIQGKAEVLHTLRAIIHKETEVPDARICLYLNDTDPYADIFTELWRTNRQYTVEQIVTFRPDSSIENTPCYNVRRIRGMLPTALLSHSQYHVFYCYISEEPQSHLQPLMYYIATPNYLITLNQDHSVAYINRDTSLIRFYKKQFELTKEECQPLISYSSDPFDVLTAYMDSTDISGYYTFMTQPCTGRYYTRELIEKYIRPDLPYRKELIEMSAKRFSVLGQMRSGYYTVFTEEGLSQFATDGYISDLPKAQVLPLSLEDRLGLLIRLRKDIHEDVICGMIANPDMLPIPKYLTFTCDPKYGFHVYAVDGWVSGGYTCNLHIKAVNIGSAFCNFIRFLPNSKYVYPKEQTLTILDHYIEQMKTALAKENTHD